MLHHKLYRSTQLVTLVRLRHDGTPVAKRRPNVRGPRICLWCQGRIVAKSGKYGRETCSMLCRNRLAGFRRSEKVALQGYAERFARKIAQKQERSVYAANRQKRRREAGLCRRCPNFLSWRSRVYCARCLDLIRLQRLKKQKNGQCRECGEPRGASRSKWYCQLCSDHHNTRGYLGAPPQWHRVRRWTDRDEPMKFIQARVSQSFADRVDAFATRYDMTRSELLRQALDSYMEITEKEEQDNKPCEQSSSSLASY